MSPSKQQFYEADYYPVLQISKWRWITFTSPPAVSGGTRIFARSSCGSHCGTCGPRTCKPYRRSHVSGCRGKHAWKHHLKHSVSPHPPSSPHEDKQRKYNKMWFAFSSEWWGGLGIWRSFYIFFQIYIWQGLKWIFGICWAEKKIKPPFLDSVIFYLNLLGNCWTLQLEVSASSTSLRSVCILVNVCRLYWFSFSKQFLC